MNGTYFVQSSTDESSRNVNINIISQHFKFC